MKVGLQLSSLQEYLQTPDDVRKTFEKVKDMGYKYVQIQYIGDGVSTESVKESLDKTNLICVGTQDDLYGFYESLDKIIARNLLWQAKYVCVAVFIPKDNNEIKELAIKLNTISKRLKSNGLILEIHPLYPSFAPFGASTPFDIMWKQLDVDILLQPDFFHTHMANINTADMLEMYNERIIQAHLKDFNILDNRQNIVPGDNFDDLEYCIFTPVGQGIIPYKNIVNECRGINLKFCWVEQEKWDRNAFDCMKESLEFLKTVMQQGDVS